MSNLSVREGRLFLRDGCWRRGFAFVCSARKFQTDYVMMYYKPPIVSYTKEKRSKQRLSVVCCVAACGGQSNCFFHDNNMCNITKSIHPIQWISFNSIIRQQEEELTDASVPRGTQQ